MQKNQSQKPICSRDIEDERIVKDVMSQTNMLGLFASVMAIYMQNIRASHQSIHK